MEFTLLWAALTSLVAMAAALRLWPSETPRSAMDHLIAAAVIGLLVGRIGAMLIQGTNPLTHWRDILLVRGGVNAGLASVAALATLTYRLRANPIGLGALAPVALIGLAGWHAGCVWRAGACLGSASTLPWAWPLPGSEIARHPVEMYAAVGMLVAAVLVRHLATTPGARVGFALVGASAVRLFTEPLRLTVLGGYEVTYAAGIAAGMLILLVALVTKRGLVGTDRLESTAGADETAAGEHPGRDS